jgi:hypothetical protein
MGLRSDHQTGTSDGRKGQTPVIPGTGQRFRCNVISTITNRGRLAFMVFRSRFTTPVFLRFLRRLLRHVRRPREAAELVTTVRSYLWSTQRQPMLVQSYFQAESVQYAA